MKLQPEPVWGRAVAARDMHRSSVDHVSAARQVVPQVDVHDLTQGMYIS